MKWMIDLNRSREGALRLQFGGDRFERNVRTRERNRTWPVDGGNRNSSIVPRDKRQGFFFRQSNRRASFLLRVRRTP